MQKSFYRFPTRFVLCMLPFAVSTTLFAETIALTDHQAWDFGIQALYLKPTYTDGFGYLDDTRVALNTDRKNALNRNWGWGLKLEASYHFCLNRDINLNWSHYKKSADGSFVFRTNPTADHYTVTPEWDAVNFEFGQSVHFDQSKNLRLHGGLQYAQIKTTYTGNGIDPIAGPGTEHSRMKYSGLGPRVGADLAVGLIPPGFFVYAGGDLALLVGNSKFKFRETFAIPFAISGSRQTTVPEVGLKIGAKYDYMMPQGHLIVDLGYQVVNYFNVVNLQDDFDSFETNFALHGVFVGVKWVSC